MTMLTAEIDAAVEKKAEKSEVDSTMIGKVREFIEETRRSRLEWEVECFVNEMMKKGRHYVNDKGRVDSRDPHQLRRTVNKFRTMLRRMKNAVTFNDPVIDVLPEVGKEEDASPEELDMASWLCLREYKQNNLQSLIKQAVETAALKTWALISVTPNDNDDYRERLTICQTYDSLDVFFDTPDMSKSRRLVISSLEDREYLKALGYDVSKVSDTSTSSHSYSKTRLDEISGRRQYTDKVLIDQVFAIEYDETDDGVGYKKETKRVVTYVIAGGIALTEKKILKGYTCLDQLFHVYYLEEDQFDAYNPPWMSDVVPLQRSLNEASENIDTILHSFAKARFTQRAGDTDNIRILQNKHMQLFQYDGAAPTPMEMPNPPQALFEVMGMRDQQIENQVGQHGASMGVKEGTQSGRHAALIQAGDQDNMKEPADTLQAALSWMFEQVLDIGSKNIDDVMQLYSPDGSESRSVIGEQYAFEAPAEGEQPAAGEKKAMTKKARKSEYANSIPLRAFKNIRVAVVPGSFFTLAQAKSDYMEMLPIMTKLGMKVEAKALWKVMMRLMNVGLSRNLARAVESEEKKIEVGNADWVIAEQEFLKMSNGESVTATPEQDHEVHLRVKVPGLQAIAQKYGQDNDAYWMILKNVQQHYQMMQMKRGQAPEATKAIDAAAGAEREAPGGAAQLPPAPEQAEAPPARVQPAPLPMPG